LEKTKIELRSALKIVEMMKEDIAKDATLTANDFHMASGNSEGIQIHINRQRKEKNEANKLKNHSETYVSPRNSYEVLPNLNELGKHNEATKEKTHKYSKAGKNHKQEEIIPERNNNLKGSENVQRMNHIPVIVNGAIMTDNKKELTKGMINKYSRGYYNNIRKYGTKSVNSTTTSQKIVNSNIPKQTETAIQRNRKILIIWDSHARGLANKIKDELGDVFTVTGITKPNADIKGITSSLSVSRDNLTKEDIIIVIGGTKDISKNEAKEGLHSIKAFLHRTINTNVIILGAPHRYDLQAIYRTVLKKAKRIQFEKQVITAVNKPKKIWDIINNELGKYNRIRDNIEIQNGMNVITNPLSIAERFNSYFIDIIMELKGDINMLNLDNGIVNYYSNSFYLVPVTDHEVEKTIKNLKNAYLMGVDGFSEIIIKNCGPYLMKPLVYIFNLSFQSGIFPDMLKVAKIIPIHKNGDQRIIANYRPISILSVFSKILEKIMYKRLISFLHKNNILSNEQFVLDKATQRN
jgi:hypothetical protein